MWGDSTGYRAMGGERIFGGVSGETAKRLPDPRRLYRWRITPVGVGLAGEGVEHPPPLSHASPIERCSLEHPHRPVLCSDSLAESRPMG